MMIMMIICFLVILTILYFMYNKKRGSKHLKQLYSFGKRAFKYPRKWSKSYCLSTRCDKMGFSQKASCRPYKNCYKV